jgi:GNAT superfamily N-acetyltransferase
MTIRRCELAELDEVYRVVNDAAEAYRETIPPDRWHDPYMAREELQREVDAGVVFWGTFENELLLGVMGLQHVGDVALIRHAYTRTVSQGKGVGTALLEFLRNQVDRPMLVGTWRAATWAIRFYERHGFSLVTNQQKDVLLRRYWTIPDRQVEESVVLADARWFDGVRGVG